MRTSTILLLGFAGIFFVAPIVYAQLLPETLASDSVVAEFIPVQWIPMAGLAIHLLASVLNTVLSDKSYFGKVVRIFSLAVGPRGRNDPAAQLQPLKFLGRLGVVVPTLLACTLLFGGCATDWGKLGGQAGGLLCDNVGVRIGPLTFDVCDVIPLRPDPEEPTPAF